MVVELEKGLVTIRFQGYSMFPFLKPGDLLLAKKGEANPVELGDIVFFNTQDSPCVLTAHRVIYKTREGRLFTKGDNLPVPDPGFLKSEDIIATATMIIRGRHLRPLARGLYRWMGKLMVYFSRKNLTPGLIASRIKHLLVPFS